MRTYLAAASASVAVALGSTAATAQDERDLSNNQLFCEIVQGVGNDPVRNAQILADINRDYAGMTERISRRKSFILNRATQLTFTGCKMRIRFDAEMRRKIRRDASGTVDVVATMKNLRFNAATRVGRACVKDAEVDDVTLSNTLRIGEFSYKTIANRVMEKPTCFDLIGR